MLFTRHTQELQYINSSLGNKARKILQNYIAERFPEANLRKYKCVSYISSDYLLSTFRFESGIGEVCVVHFDFEKFRATLVYACNGVVDIKKYSFFVNVVEE